MCKLTSDVKGKWLNGMEVSREEAEKLMEDNNKTFFHAPSIAPRGFVDCVTGMSVFPIIDRDGEATGTFMIYEVLDQHPDGLKHPDDNG